MSPHATSNERLATIEATVKHIDQRLTETLARLTQVMGDHEQRLREIERRQWSLAGMATLLGSALATLTSYILHRLGIS